MVLEANDITPNAWDIIQVAWIWGLDESIYFDITPSHGHVPQLRRQRFQFGTAAYIISKEGMEKITSSFFSDNTAGSIICLDDGGKQAELYVSAASNIYVAVPSFFTIEGSDTSISVGEEEEKRLQGHQKSNIMHIKATMDLIYQNNPIN